MAITKQSMKESLQDKSVAWIQFTRMNFRSYPQAIHCFFEGEDRKYYMDRVEDISLYPLEKIVGYDCKGKKNVIKLWEKIKSNQKYESAVVSFYIDKDYCSTHEDYDKSVYETPYHSLENFYVTYDAIKKILVKEFGINAIDSDYKKTLLDYENRLKEFRSILAGLNTFIICFQKIDSFLQIDKFKLQDFVKISIKEIKVLKDMSFEKLKNYYHNKLLEEYNRGKMHSEKNLIRYLEDIVLVEEIFEAELRVVNNNLEKLSHGKFELYFLKEILEDLKRLNKENDYFSFKRDNISLDANSNNFLSNLSKYATTPECLKNFLNSYRICETEKLVGVN